jgi:ATP-binding cassette subfamily B protein/ATP-binding cassette subfamily C protein
VQQIVSRAINSVNNLVSTVGTIDEDIANLVDYERFMTLPVRQSGGINLTSAPSKIRLKNVSFHYPSNDSAKILKDITLSINHGQNVAIVGENGAGKTTLIKLLTGLYKPTEGSILLDNTDLNEVNIASWHKQLGVLQQSYASYDFATARHNVMFGDVDAPAEEGRFERALEEAEATEFIRKLPQGADTYVNTWIEDDKGNKGVELSGGQWQRLALARDFYRSAPIIILDEPTSAIDALAEARIFKRLFNNDSRTVITISHRFSTIKKADIVYMLKDGSIVESGTCDELVAKKGEFYHMFESQIK